MMCLYEMENAERRATINAWSPEEIKTQINLYTTILQCLYKGARRWTEPGVLYNPWGTTEPDVGYDDYEDRHYEMCHLEDNYTNKPREKSPSVDYLDYLMGEMWDAAEHYFVYGDQLSWDYEYASRGLILTAGTDNWHSVNLIRRNGSKLSPDEIKEKYPEYLL